MLSTATEENAALEKNYRFVKNPIWAGAALVWVGWLAIMLMGDHWHYFAKKYYMSITMIFGSFIAGATSEGGGAVAFPVMTLFFKIKPHIARDFSFCIQAVGMMAAAFTIYCMKVSVEWRAVLYAGLGGVLGVAIGLDVISPLLSPPHTKLFFVSTWLSFAAALFWINRYKGRETHEGIMNFETRHAVLLFLTGIIGGCVSGITGSGLDIVTFSLLVLTFRVDEKVATPTSVVLMGMNALVGVIWREGVTTGMAAAAWEYWYVCVPIVVVGAPAGAWFIKGKSRLFVAGFLYISILVQYIAALAIIPMSTELIVFSTAVVVVGLLFFGQMAWFGKRRLNWLRNASPKGAHS